MAKFDAVDRLMKLAEGKAVPGGRPDTLRSPETAIPAQAAETTALSKARPQQAARPPASPGERGREWLGAIRPLLPAVGGALRMVDHGAVQAVARLLPLLGSVRTGPAPAAQTAPQPPASQTSSHGELAAVQRELTALQTRAATQEEQLRRLRESIERSAAEQGTLLQLAHTLGGRVRLLTAGLLILLALVIAEGVLLAFSVSR